MIPDNIDYLSDDETRQMNMRVPAAAYAHIAAVGAMHRAANLVQEFEAEEDLEALAERRRVRVPHMDSVLAKLYIYAPVEQARQRFVAVQSDVSAYESALSDLEGLAGTRDRAAYTKARAKVVALGAYAAAHYALASVRWPLGAKDE